MKLATKNLAFRKTNFQKRFFIIDIGAGIFRYVKNEDEAQKEIKPVINYTIGESTLIKSDKHPFHTYNEIL